MPTIPELSRRAFATAAAVSLAGLTAFCIDASTPAFAEDASVGLDQLMAPVADGVPDIVQGASDAPVTIVEYASLTCGHCAAFYATTYPELKRKYIDTGKVKFVLREFPRDPLDLAAFMLARCVGDDKRTALVDFLFAQQKTWAYAEKPRTSLVNLVKQAGVSEAAFDACLSNKDLSKKVLAVHSRAESIFGVKATPTFFVNGKREDGELSIENLDKLLAPLLKG